MFNFKFPYRDRVPENDDSDREDAESLLEKANGQRDARKSERSSFRYILIGVFSHLAVFIIALGVGRHFFYPSESGFLNKIQHWSTMNNDVQIKYSPTRFNGSFLHLNAYRQDAGPEVDAAWEALGVNYRAIAVSEEDALRSGLQPSQVKINPKYGGGYPANVEGLHQLHCLNLVRMSLSWNIDYYQKKGHGAFSNEFHILKDHVTHCLDIIRQQLMCTVDTGVLGQVWWGKPEDPNAFVDFNTVHMCKNYEDIRSWAEARQLPPAEDTPGDFLMPPRSSEDVLPSIP